MKPTIGRIVHYRPTQSEVGELSRTGNKCEILPAIITNVWENSVNLKVIADGELDLWVTSVSQGEKQGEWNWPKIEK
jgi:hypothetical protein